MKKGLSVRETERLVKRMLEGDKPKPRERAEQERGHTAPRNRGVGKAGREGQPGSRRKGHGQAGHQLQQPRRTRRHPQTHQVNGYQSPYFSWHHAAAIRYQSPCLLIWAVSRGDSNVPQGQPRCRLAMLRLWCPAFPGWLCRAIRITLHSVGCDGRRHVFDNSRLPRVRQASRLSSSTGRTSRSGHTA